MRVVCIGDSLTHGFKIKSSEIWTSLIQKKYNIEVINKGIIGDTTEGMMDRFYVDVIKEKPTHVIIMGGTNDLIRKVPVGVIRTNIEFMALRARVYKIIPIIGIQVLSEPMMAQEYWTYVKDFPRINRDIIELREHIIKFGKNFNVQIIDFYDEIRKHFTMENKLDLYIDGVHLTVKGNEIMANAVKIV